MKRALAIAAGLLVALWLGGVLIQSFAEDPQPRTTPAEADPEPAPDPKPIVSDSELLKEKPFRIREKARATDGSTLENAPYLIVLRDGRYAFGYTNDHGDTLDLFTPERVDYDVFYYEEAWSRLRALDAGAPRR